MQKGQWPQLMSSDCQLQAFEGSYEWMLYGHDDTLFFVEGILDLLQDFDPALPYIITGVNTPQAAACHA